MNVLIIMTDQQRADHLSCAGNPVLKTPNIDSIGKVGIRFTNAFCANPCVCQIEQAWLQGYIQWCMVLEAMELIYPQMFQLSLKF